MFVTPGSAEWSRGQLTRELAGRAASYWWTLLIEGLLFIVAGVLIFTIDWSVQSLSILIGVLFILHGISTGFGRGLDRATHWANILTGLLSIAAGVAIMVWPTPGLIVVGIFLGVWLILVGTLTISGAFAGRPLIPDWWLWLVVGLLEIPLGVVALADPGGTLAALLTVAGIWGVVVGAICVVMAFEVRRLPHRVEDAETMRVYDGRRVEARQYAPTHAAGATP
jgi:uncharacterized membrane protein HdeD (DUF308 family)